MILLEPYVFHSSGFHGNMPRGALAVKGISVMVKLASLLPPYRWDEIAGEINEWYGMRLTGQELVEYLTGARAVPEQVWSRITQYVYEQYGKTLLPDKVRREGFN
jgi:hypothetical protein